MPWPQLPTADDVFQTIKLFFIILVCFVVAAAVSSFFYSRTDYAKERAKVEHQREIERAEKRLENLKRGTP